jgi:hypothetical protein
VKIKIKNGEQEWNFPDVSYEHFTEHSKLYKEGASDTEYEKHLRENNMIEITDFNESVQDTIIEIENYDGDRKLKFACIYDSEVGNYSDIRDLYKELCKAHVEKRQLEDGANELRRQESVIIDQEVNLGKLLKEDRDIHDKKYISNSNNLESVTKFIEYMEKRLNLN